MKRHLINLLMTVCAPLLSGALTSCFTGVESTRKVTMTRGERKATRPSAEQVFADTLRGTPLRNWPEGKAFAIADARASLIFEPASVALLPSDTLLKEGVTLTYAGIDILPSASGRPVTAIRFRLGDHTLRYMTGRSEEETAEISSTTLPMLIDRSVVELADRLLRGKEIWTRTMLWYDAAGERARGRRFSAVEVDSVTPGTLVFPLRIHFHETEPAAAGFASSGSVLISIGEGGGDSRPFENMFLFENPRRRYPQTADDVWELLRRGDVRAGMTKEECRLALGNPSLTDAGQDRMRVIELWQYPDGIFLRFEDGVLVDFRK